VFEKSAEGEKGAMIATIICKAEMEEDVLKGYIAMLTVSDAYRKRGIGQTLASLCINRMHQFGCDEIVLETEVALSLHKKIEC